MLVRCSLYTLCLIALLLLAQDAAAKSPKRGVAYNLQSQGDMGALSSGASWFYNWSPFPAQELGNDFRQKFGMEFVPMIWGTDFDHNAVVGYMKANGVRNFLVLNEPNLAEQANVDPGRAAENWPKYEAVARETGARLIGPQITWGTANERDPVVWMDAFFDSYRKRFGREAQVDAIGFHWYDYDVGAQLDRLRKFGKPFWVTELANWHVGDGSAQIDNEQKQKEQMRVMIGQLEGRADVERYAWFTGRWDKEGDWHHTSLLTGNGFLSDLGVTFISI